MKNGQILARKSTNRGALDIEYLDEKSEIKKYLRQRSLEKTEIGKKLKTFADYASKETTGQVHVGGFLHHLVCENPDGTHTAPKNLSNEERKARIVKNWMEHLSNFTSRKGKKKKVIQHRLTLSMSTPQHDALVAAGINPDQVLHKTMKRIMAKFKDKFHPRDSIGYAYGFHHDTDNLHVHVALCPRTKLGKYVGCSTGFTEQSRNKGQFDYIRECFELENKLWEKRIKNPQELKNFLSESYDNHKIVFSPRITALRRNQLVASHNRHVEQLQQLYTRINALELELQKIHYEKATRKIKNSFDLLLQSISRKRSLLPKIQNRSYLLIRKKQQQLFELRYQYNGLYYQYQKNYPSYGAHRTAKQQIHGYRHGNSQRVTTV